MKGGTIFVGSMLAGPMLCLVILMRRSGLEFVSLAEEVWVWLTIALSIMLIAASFL